MKKLVILSLLLAMTVSAAACGVEDGRVSSPGAGVVSNDSSSAAEDTAENTEEVTAEETDEAEETEPVTAEDTTLNLLEEYSASPEEVDEAVSLIKETAKKAVDLTAQPIPEFTVPDDWHQITDGKVSLYVPSDVTELASGSLKRFQNEDKSIIILFMSGNDWSQEEEDETFTQLIPEAKTENTIKAFAGLGIEYDGTRRSFYRAALSFTSADRTEENAEDFDAAVIAKGLAFDIYPEIFFMEKDGKDFYAHGMNTLLPDYSLEAGSQEPDPDYHNIWLGAFADDNIEYTVMIKTPTKEESLHIASTAAIN